MRRKAHLLPLALLGCAVMSAPTFAGSELGPAQLLARREEARAYEHGEGVTKNPAKAYRLYCEGAKAGDAEARYGIGWMLANGRGIARDDAQAAYFFALAAAQGHEPSRRMLGFLGAPATEMPECLRDPEPPATVALDDFAFTSGRQRELAELVLRLAPEYGIEPRLALAIAHTESNLNPNAVSNKHAQGLMQLIPDTAARFNVRKPFDPEQNVRGGLTYLRWLLAYFQGDVALAAAAYNAGEGAVNRYRGIPPYAETRGYVQRILEKFPREEHPFDASVTPPSPELDRILRKKQRIRS